MRLDGGARKGGSERRRLPSPHRLHVRVTTDHLILADQHRSLVTRRGNDNLVRRVAVKRLRQAATIDQDRTSDLRDAEPLNAHRLVEPLAERPIEDELL